ncbi:hypothetical protein KMZ30_06950 [Phycicoccus sp. KQZ13P-1]|uniref:hypothetical protein n=1 Tax=Phycicoccus mangrovi TaxID=2840470 RepID=UPI001C005008|nr:hypothetical protein [Phycicoccus mangrovi]MBT9255312.1 hypothetical protein [Phycicoccus mangrovi]
MKRTAYVSTPETQTRLLLLIDTFSRKRNGDPRLLEGRTKLAKLDFLLRYPKHLNRALDALGVKGGGAPSDSSRIADKMLRYRYGPWDPQYYSALGGLLGRGLIIALPTPRGYGYRTTNEGERLCEWLLEDDSFEDLARTLPVLRRHFDWTGNKLKTFIYEIVPELNELEWTKELS